MPKYLLIILLANCLSLRAFAQQPPDKEIPIFYEKVYLHTDRTVYAQNDDIWFKAYLVNAADNTPINYSRILYVEVINPSAKIISRAVLRLENGRGNGDFKIPDSIATGAYRIRAYTNWMRNFGDTFIYQKDISIVGITDLQAIVSAQKSNSKLPIQPTPITPIDNKPMVDFFPEGGSLINGVSSTVGVKALDANGRGVPATGEVVNNSGAVICTFKCDSLGFGYFQLLADIAQNYKVRVSINGEPYTYGLPKIQSEGFNMSVGYGLNIIDLSINCNELTYTKAIGNRLYITARHGGKTYFKKAVLIDAKRISAGIPDIDLPDGIAEITVADEQGEPLCERLIYVYHPQIKLTATIDKAEYQPKEKVIVKLKLNSDQAANLSVAAVDANTAPVQAAHILAYLNLQSELKGEIEQPNRYFDTTNVNRSKQMDLLLLTQGWRNFVWKSIRDTTLTLPYELEQGFTVTGRVRKVGADKSMPGINVTMRAPNASGQKLFAALTDAEGKFTIYDPVFYGLNYLYFTARNSSKLNSEGDSKGFSSGWIKVDSLHRDTLPVNMFKPFPDTSGNDKKALANIAINLKNTRLLNEVKIKAYTSRLFTVLPVEIHAITLAEQKDYTTLANYLTYIVEGAQIEHAMCYCGPEGPILQQMGRVPKRISIRGFYADGSKMPKCICQEDYLNQPMSNILKVTINRVMDVGGKNISVSVILRPGVLENKNYFDNTVANITGYYKARVFYSPRFESKDEKPDLRTNTIYWNPNLVTDSKGEATISFNNTERKGKVQLIVQGVTDSGMPLVASVDYGVK